MQTSIVLGVNGQDGSFLAESLLLRGHLVIGIGRQPASRYVPANERFNYIEHDLCDAIGLCKILGDYSPDFAFHTATVHGPDGFDFERVFGEMLSVDVGSLHSLLEHARLNSPSMRIVYFGTRRVFPNPLRGTIDETTLMLPTCTYSVGKLASRELIRLYREKHGIAGTNLILFHHESVRRGSHYFLPMICEAVVRAENDATHTAAVRTLQFYADWSAADEIADIAVDIAVHTEGDEFVLASGHTWHGRDVVTAIFARFGLEARRHIVEREPGQGTDTEFRVILDKLERAIGRRPRKSVTEIAEQIVGQVRSAV